MWITLSILAVVATLMIGLTANSSAQLVESALLRRLVLAGAALSVVLANALLFELLIPAPPQKEGVLEKSGDTVPLGEVSGGLLSIECRAKEGVEKKGETLDVNLFVKGASDKHKEQTAFQFGPKISLSEDDRDENLAKNIRLGDLGADATLQLISISPQDKAVVHVAYHPSRFPVRPAFILFAILALLAGAFEGAAPSGYRRTLLTAALFVTGTFLWMLEPGLTAEDNAWSIWIRIAYATGAGAVGGTVLPMLTSTVLPTLEARA